MDPDPSQFWNPSFTSKVCMYYVYYTLPYPSVTLKVPKIIRIVKNHYEEAPQDTLPHFTAKLVGDVYA